MPLLPLLSSRCGHFVDLKSLKVCLDSLDQQPFPVNSTSFIYLLRHCSAIKALEEGRRLHQHLIRAGLDRKRLFAHLLMNMYGKCGSTGDAHKIFDRMGNRNVVSWTTMIAIYAEEGSGKLAFRLFEKMRNAGVMPNKVTFLSILNAFVDPWDLGSLTRIHALISATPYNSDLSIRNALIHAYGKCGSLKDAQMVFDAMPDRDVISWNTLIAAYSHSDHGNAALQLYGRMNAEGVVPTKVTFLAALDACINTMSLEQGQMVHGHISHSSLASDLNLGNALINMYGKCGSPQQARIVFRNMGERDVVSWTSMIAVCTQQGFHKEAIQLFQEMNLNSLQPNKVTVLSVVGAFESPAALSQARLFHQYLVYRGFNCDGDVGNSLVNMYAKCGGLEDACSLFKQLDKRDVVLWNTMIAMYNQHGQSDAALEAFKDMQRVGVVPDRITLLSVLDACASLAALEDGISIHSLFADKQFKDPAMATALLDMYGKCGNLEDACRIFDDAAERDVFTWNTMIATYGQHGNGLSGLHLFSVMQVNGLKPDNVSFIAVLTACSHSGLVEQGSRYFTSMKVCDSFIPTIRHYGCMVDLFCRAGELDEAESLITNMPFQPDAVIWMMLFNACRLHGDVERGIHAAMNLIELDPTNGALYLILSNLYAAAGLWDNVSILREVVAEKNTYRQSGHSIIYVKNKKHVFVVSDSSHPQRLAIYAQLERLGRLTKQAGYVPDLNLVPHNVEEQEKENLLLSHSEKLAVAFALISTPFKAGIRIINNLCVCGDCHSFLKVVSKVVEREILIRDANRFHHFKNGVCSCGDYW